MILFHHFHETTQMRFYGCVDGFLIFQFHAIVSNFFLWILYWTWLFQTSEISFVFNTDTEYQVFHHQKLIFRYRISSLIFHYLCIRHSSKGLQSTLLHYYFLQTFSGKYEILCKTFDSEAKSVLEVWSSCCITRIYDKIPDQI